MASPDLSLLGAEPDADSAPPRGARDLKDHALPALRELFRRDGLPPYRAEQVLTWIYRHRIEDIDANETLRAAVSPTGLAVLDANSQLRALMSPVGIGVHDANGTMRGLMRSAEIGYFDAEGNLLWRAPE